MTHSRPAPPTPSPNRPKRLSGTIDPRPGVPPGESLSLKRTRSSPKTSVGTRPSPGDIDPDADYGTQSQSQSTLHAPITRGPVQVPAIGDVSSLRRPVA